MSDASLTTYRVHIYREMRLVFDGIQVETVETAARMAGDKHFDDCDDWSDCEGETLWALVDYAPDEGTFIDFEAGRMLNLSRKIIDLLKQLLPEIDSEIDQRQHGGNHEDWAALKRLSDEAHAMVRQATDGVP